MDGYGVLSSWLPASLGAIWQTLPPLRRAEIHEIRLRAGQAVSVGCGGREWYLTPHGELTTHREAAVVCDVAWVNDIVERACQQSLYAHQEELRQGFLPAPQGCRIGIAGTAVTEHGHIVGYRHITALCLRVAREHRGCAADLAKRLCQQGVNSALVCGEPSSGKTSLLRDLLWELTERRLSVTVVDERGELTGDTVPSGCDVLRGAPKAEGLLQAIRCLSPRVVVFDELGSAAEWEAVGEALTCGVPVITSIHCRQTRELLHRKVVRTALQNGAFSYIVQLRGSATPGKIASIMSAEEWQHEVFGSRVGLVDRCWMGPRR